MISRASYGVLQSVLSVILVVADLHGQSAFAEFRAESSLVLVPVTVTGRGGAFLNELSRESFSVFDNHQAQPITAFYSVDAPCALGIVLDISGSVRDRLDRLKTAARTAVSALDERDEFFLMTVSSSPQMRSGMGSNPASIAEALFGLQAGGWTSLYDTIRAAISEVRRSPKQRRALLVISDGIDNHSRTGKPELMRALEEADVRVYSIAVENASAGRKPIQMTEDQRGLGLMEDLAQKTGGLCLRTGPEQDPADAARKLAAALRNQYVLGYRTPRSGTGKWHTIQVKIDRQHSNVYARSGYREP